MTKSEIEKLKEQIEDMRATLSLINSVARAKTGSGGVGGCDWEDVKQWTDQYKRNQS